MNTILESRALAIAQSFRALDSYSPTREMILHLIKQGKIDISEPALKSKGVVLEYFVREGMKYNIHIPVFSQKEGKITLLHEQLFDSFVLSNIFASFLRGIDQYPAGTCMYEHGFEQFAMFCHYTSIYQLVHAMLLLHGICFVANPISGQNVQTVRTEKTEEGRKEIVKITFAYLGKSCLQGDYKSGSWTFAPCGFSHEERWKRFAEILKKYIGNNWINQIPNGVKRYYGYLKVIEEYREHRWKPKKVYQIGFKDSEEFKRILNKSWRLIPKIRNEAIYKNIRYDIAERVDIREGVFPKELLDARMEILRKFNETMIDWVCNYIQESITKIKGILKDNSLFYRSLNTVSSNPIIDISDPDLKRMQESSELDRINKNIKEIIPVILPPDKVKIGEM